MTIITGSDLFTQAWNITYKVISGNVTDPISRGGSKWMFADYPEIQRGKNDDHPGFPIITIDNFNTDSEPVTFNYGKRSYDLNTIISIHTKDRRTIDTVSSDIIQAFSLESNTLIESGLHAYSLVSGGTETLTLDRNHKIHTKSLGLGYRVLI